MADVFTVLATDHEEVKGMLAELEEGPTKASGASQDQLTQRLKMLKAAGPAAAAADKVRDTVTGRGSD